MVQAHEILTLLAGLVILAIVWSERRYLRRLPSATLLALGYAVLVVGWGAAILDAVLWPTLMETVQHASWTAAALAAVVWIVKVSEAGNAERSVDAGRDL
ncbi:MAG: hypothetical protein ACP5HG_14770 [Anaerolineae bacterium]